MSATIRRPQFSFILALILAFSLQGTAYAGVLANDEDLDSGAEDIDLTNGQAVARSSGVFDFANPVSGSPIVGLDMEDKDLIMDGAYLTVGTPTIHISLNLNGGDLTSTTGYIKTDSIRGTGSIIITNVGDVLMNSGYMSTKDLSSSFGGSERGIVTIGENADGRRAGDVQIAGITTYDITADNGGNVSIYATGDVLIKDTLNTPSTSDDVAKDIDTHYTQGAANGRLAGTITVLHNGSFLANDILAQDVRVNNLTAIHHQFDGAVVGTASGSFTANDIVTADTGYYAASHQRSGVAGDLTIKNYTSVSVHNIDAEFKDYIETTSCGGDVTITGITANITITGTLSLDATNHSDTAYNGVLSLSCGGTITLEQGLDLSKVDYAVFNPGTTDGNAYIEGDLLNIDTDDATVVSLRAPTGDVVWYDPFDLPTDPVAANQYLYDNDTFDGTKDGIWALTNGGELKPLYPLANPTVFIIR